LASLALARKILALAMVSGESVVTCRQLWIAFSMIILEGLWESPQIISSDKSQLKPENLPFKAEALDGVE
jgi:hypothetical protein